MNYPRRTFLVASGTATIALLATRGFGRAPGAACYDPNAVSSGEAELRRSLEYTEHAADPAKRCEHCAFATFAKEGCGTCQMFSGGPISRGAVCSSFSAKGG